MKRNRKPIVSEDDSPSAEEMLKEIIKKKEVEKQALKKIMDSLEKKRKPNS